MKKKNVILMIILFYTAFLYFKEGILFAKEPSDFFNDIIIKTNSKVVEYGIQATFEVKNYNKETCKELLRILNLDNYNTEILIDKDTYCIEFSKTNTKGYIELNQYNNENILTLSIDETSDENGLVYITDNLKKFINENHTQISIYKYLKAKIPNGVEECTNNLVINMLKQLKAENIQTVKINNGFSTLANTKIYEAKNINGKLIDFNYSICKYSSGSYIILGTPEIIVSY